MSVSEEEGHAEGWIIAPSDRDRVAELAMTSLLCGDMAWGPDDLARASYAIADAMLAERIRPGVVAKVVRLGAQERSDGAGG
jgi:hypothetical protein